MLFEKYLMPDLVLPSFREITPALLQEKKIRFLLSDIDNTLVTYSDPEPTPEVRAFFAMLNALDIKIGFLSNNHPQRVERFNASLGYVAIADANKPGVMAAKLAMAKLGASPEHTMFLGDQLLTDAACAKQLGLYTVIVPPIRDRTDVFHRFKRWLEVPYLKKYRKNHKVD